MRYVVDPDQLRKLGSELVQTAGALDQLGAASGPGAIADLSSALGSPAVAEAVREVTGNWSQARRRLAFDLAHLARATQAAAVSYALVDERSVPVAERSARPGAVAAGAAR